MGRAAIVVVSLLVPAALLPGCINEGGVEDAQGLENHFAATEERPYSFDYPSEWVLADEGGGDVPLGIDDSVGMVLEPIHPWLGTGAFGRRGAERVEVDGYEAYRMILGRPGEHGLAYRIQRERHRRDRVVLRERGGRLRRAAVRRDHALVPDRRGIPDRRLSRRPCSFPGLPS
jgi:hypothetical protein